jgi:hypothetical protein
MHVISLTLAAMWGAAAVANSQVHSLVYIVRIESDETRWAIINDFDVRNRLMDSSICLRKILTTFGIKIHFAYSLCLDVRLSD